MPFLCLIPSSVKAQSIHTWNGHNVINSICVFMADLSMFIQPTPSQLQPSFIFKDHIITVSSSNFYHGGWLLVVIMGLSNNFIPCQWKQSYFPTIHILVLSQSDLISICVICCKYLLLSFLHTAANTGLATCWFYACSKIIFNCQLLSFWYVIIWGYIQLCTIESVNNANSLSYPVTVTNKYQLNTHHLFSCMYIYIATTQPT